MSFEAVADGGRICEAIYELGSYNDECYAAVISAGLTLLADMPEDRLLELAREFRRAASESERIVN